MKLLLKLFLVALVGLGGFNFYAYHQSGKIPAVAWWNEFAREHGVKSQIDLDQVVSSAKKVAQSVEEKAGLAADEATSDTQKIKIYKWVDAKGVVHYENRPVENAQAIEVDPSTNVLSIAPAPVIEAAPKPKEKVQSADEQAEQIRQAKQKYMDALTQ